MGREDIDRVVIDIDIFVEAVDQLADPFHIDELAEVDGFSAHDDLLCLFRVFAVVVLGQYLFDIDRDERFSGHQRGIPVLEKKMIFLQHLVIGDEAGNLVEQEADLLVLLVGSVGGGFGAIAFLICDHFADEFDGGVVLIPVFAWFCLDHIFLQRVKALER